MSQRVLVLTDENVEDEQEVPEPIRPFIDRADDIYVLAPTLTTRLQSLTGDIDRPRREAYGRLHMVFEHMHASGIEAQGAVGDEDPIAAIGDALSEFDADVVLLRLNAPGSEHENWRERRLAERVRARFDLPAILFFYDQGHVVTRQEA